MRLYIMAKSKKYDFRVVQDKAGWSAEITRRITSKETAVSKSHGDFASETEAQEWGQRELKFFLDNLTERNKRRALKRETGAEE